MPSHTTITGRHCTLLPVNAESIKLHGAALYSEYCKEGDRTWTYLPYGPFDSCEHYLAWLLSLAERREGLSNDAIPCVPVLLPTHLNPRAIALTRSYQVFRCGRRCSTGSLRLLAHGAGLRMHRDWSRRLRTCAAPYNRSDGGNLVHRA